MIKTFNSYPILITKDNKRFELIEFHYQLGVEFDQLSINDTDNKEIALFSTQECISLTIPSEWGNVEFVYLDKNRIVGRHLVDLGESKTKTKEAGERVDAYNILLELVKKNIETLEGTEQEKDYQSELIHQCVINQEARKAMMSKIRHIIMRSGEVEKNKVERFTYKIFSDLWGMGVIQELDDDPDVGEILVNAQEFPYFKCDIYYYKNGTKYRYDKEIQNLNELKRIFANAVAFEGKSLNQVDRAEIETTRPNKDRVTIAQPKASENYSLAIRKFANFTPSRESMIKSGTVTQDIDHLLKVLIDGHCNIGIGGPMNTGKTTFISYLLTHTDPLERKVIIANVAETDIDRTLKGHDIILLKVDDELGFTFEKHMRVALRKTAERIIVPESRGSEFRQLFEACKKTRGNLFTGHALDDVGFYEACVDMYLSGENSGKESGSYIKDKLANGIEIVIMMRKVGKAIRIKSISEVISTDDYKFKELKTLYYWKYDSEEPNNLEKGCYCRTEHRLSDKTKARLNESGVPLSILKDL